MISKKEARQRFVLATGCWFVCGLLTGLNLGGDQFLAGVGFGAVLVTLGINLFQAITEKEGNS